MQSRKLRTHKLATTCVCTDSRDQFAFSGSKDGSIIKWNLESNKIVSKIVGIGSNALKENPAQGKFKHHRHINCIGISSDNKYLASGGYDKSIRIWNSETMTFVHSLDGHRAEVTGLIFRKNYQQLYSTSADKSVKLWTLEEENQMGYIESLFGHEATVCSIDVLKRERILTSGGRDQSIRIWKIVEQAQTVYQSNHESVDIAKYIDDKTFVSAGEGGSIALWSTQKRNPVFTIDNAHKTTDGSPGSKRFWISALATHVRSNQETSRPSKKRKMKESKENDDDDDDDGEVEERESDDSTSNDSFHSATDKLHVDAKKSFGIFVASGSCDGVVNIWQVKIDGSNHSIKFVRSIPCQGFINDLKFSRNGDKLVAAVGQEHKFGRWSRLRGVKNTIRFLETKL